MSDFPEQLASQSWTLYSIGMVVILLRMLVTPSKRISQCSFLVIGLRDGAESEVYAALQQMTG